MKVVSVKAGEPRHEELEVSEINQTWGRELARQGRDRLPFLALSGDAGESAFTWTVAGWPEDNVEEETAVVQDATGLLADVIGSKSFLLWLHSLVISRVLP